MALKIQKFIGCFDDILEANKHLQSRLKIKSDPYKIYDADGYIHEVFLYSAGQKADLQNPIVKETHGLVLYNDGSILTKLHDHPTPTEGYEIRGEWITGSQILNDGRFISVYNLEGKWRTATDKTVDGREFMVNNLPGAYLGDEFMDFIGGQAKFTVAHPDLIYVFNYTSNNNINIIDQECKDARLVAIINKVDGVECSMKLVKSVAHRLNFKLPDSIQSTISSTLSIGEMIITSQHRYFRPNPIYVALKNALEAGERVSPVHMVKLFQVCTTPSALDLVCISFPNYERMLDLIEKSYRAWANQLYTLWTAAKLYSNDAKIFSDMIKHHPLNHILHSVRRDNTTISQELRNLKPKKAAKLLEDHDPVAFKAYKQIIKFEGSDYSEESNSQEINSQKENSEEEGTIPYCQEGD